VIAALGPDSSGSRLPIGSSSESLPSSTSVMISALVIHLDAEAMGRRASGAMAPTSIR
jgi:hypothetical protein